MGESFPDNMIEIKVGTTLTIVVESDEIDSERGTIVTSRV